MDSILGLLIPRSGFYPTLGFDIQAGLQAGLIEGGTAASITTENTGFAEKESLLYGMCENMLLQGKKLVVAYINAPVAMTLQPLFEAAGAILIVLDSGYHFPVHEQRLANVVFLSLQGALCCRVAASKAVQEQQWPIAFTASYYDAGYRAPYVMTRAIEENEKHISFYHITPLKRAEFNLRAIQEWIQNTPESVLLAAFCGDMTSDFLLHLNRFEKKPTALYTGPFVAEETWLSQSVYPGMDFKAYVPWDRSLSSAANSLFIKNLKNRKPNVFSVLGYEAGLLAARIFNAGLEGQESILKLTEEGIESPRGALRIDPDTFQTCAPVYEATVGRLPDEERCQISKPLQECTDTSEHRKALQVDIASLRGASTTSWLNAYPCIV